MDLDTTPTTMLVTSVILGKKSASMRAVDEKGFAWRLTLPVAEGGAAYWFASTIKNYLGTMRSAYRLTSTYDEARDEWFVTAGNYGIKSSSITFAEED